MSAHYRLHCRSAKTELYCLHIPFAQSPLRPLKVTLRFNGRELFGSVCSGHDRLLLLRRRTARRTHVRVVVCKRSYVAQLRDIVGRTHLSCSDHRSCVCQVVWVRGSWKS